MRPKLLAVYGVIAPPPLLIIEFEKLVRLSESVQVFGIIAAEKFPNDLIFPGEFDEYALRERYDAYLDTIVAEVIEFEGDTVSASKRNAWEARLRRQEPVLMVSLTQP